MLIDAKHEYNRIRNDLTVDLKRLLFLQEPIKSNAIEKAIEPAYTSFRRSLQRTVLPYMLDRCLFYSCGEGNKLAVMEFQVELPNIEVTVGCHRFNEGAADRNCVRAIRRAFKSYRMLYYAIYSIRHSLDVMLKNETYKALVESSQRSTGKFE